MSCEMSLLFCVAHLGIMPTPPKKVELPPKTDLQ
jgi:hypothetical protein